ncbi:hypothetical protein BWZ22_13435 [Seonamhaeicola sp. S2-3]|uniref:hypothetical protein n=1 Tax=Seonamhaeicola sp. S2-3 TaxID=1936081 RepID=UPI00097273BA|nr:hypothetical protein [Seonamhaeicola sp. S2-3]APY12159.1 hypothetical protein BWZ22_13410 [Seonamhaeicola sp. S2-3]APY12164.1 hypothetical protein BWZ22_13435 [Seonamhaeicola sp. S2-3]
MDLLLVKYQDEMITSKISQEIKIDFHIVHSLAKDLVEQGLLSDYHKIAIKDIKYHGDFIARTSQKGLFFLNVEGGFKNKYKQYILNKSWTVAKIIAAVANAVIIICISIWAIIESKKSTEIENRIINLEKIHLKNPVNQKTDKNLKTDSIIDNIKND